VKVGIEPSNRRNVRAYSNGLRAFALIRGLDYCELHDPNQSYDIVVFQKVFNPIPIYQVISSGTKAVVDVCDSTELARPGRFKEAIEAADVVTVSTRMLQIDIQSEFPDKTVLVTPDVLEYSPEYAICGLRESLSTAVIFGTYHNVRFAKQYWDILRKIFKKLIVITDMDFHLDLAKKDFLNQGMEVDLRPWKWERIDKDIGEADVALLFFIDTFHALFKSANRACLALHCGVPVISMWNPEIAEIQRYLPKAVTVFKDNFLNAYSSLHCNLPDLTDDYRQSWRRWVDQSRFGYAACIAEWDKTFRRINDERND